MEPEYTATDMSTAHNDGWRAAKRTDVSLDKGNILELLKLLSALESWGFSAGVQMPDFLLERLINQIDLLTAEVLRAGG